MTRDGPTRKVPRAKARNWIVVSMKSDWKKMLPFEK